MEDSIIEKTTVSTKTVSIISVFICFICFLVAVSAMTWFIFEIFEEKRETDNEGIHRRLDDLTKTFGSHQISISIPKDAIKITNEIKMQVPEVKIDIPELREILASYELQNELITNLSRQITELMKKEQTVVEKERIVEKIVNVQQHDQYGWELGPVDDKGVRSIKIKDNVIYLNSLGEKVSEDLPVPKKF